MKPKRSSSGNTLVMTLLLVGMGIFITMIGFVVYLLFSQQGRGQAKADELALNLGSALNAGDKVGQMNNVVYRNRELVFLSRQDNTKALSMPFADYQQLSATLLNEARENAIMVESERVKLTRNILDEEKKYITSARAENDGKKHLMLMWFQTFEPRIGNVSLGSIQGMPSSVYANRNVPDLYLKDSKAKWIQPTSDLFIGDVIIKLPPPDDDLMFKISSLPAEVGGTVAQARLVHAINFNKSLNFFLGEFYTDKIPEYCPSAVQVNDLMKVSTMASESDINITSTSVTNGAQPAP